MRVHIQRVKRAEVHINGKVHSSIGEGMLLLLGCHSEDTSVDIDWLVQKVVNMRIFPDDEGKMNCSILDRKGEILVVSQFTLFASTKKGNRPGFSAAARPEQAIPLYENFIQSLKTFGLNVKTGVFGADMQVELINDGPVTILIDSKNRE